MLIVEGPDDTSIKDVADTIGNDFKLYKFSTTSHPISPAVARKNCHTSIEMAHKPVIQIRSNVISEYILPEYCTRVNGCMCPLELSLYQRILMRAPVIIIYVRPKPETTQLGYMRDSYDHLLWSAPFSTKTVITYNLDKEYYRELVYNRVADHLSKVKANV